MKRKLSYTLLSLCIILFIYLIKTNLSIQSFNADTVMNHIKFLSSEQLKGRLPGTLENLQTAEYVKSEYIKNGLKPLSKDYFESFNVNCPEALKEQPYLKITDKNGKTIKEYAYGIDYREDMLNFKTNNFKFNKSDSVYQGTDSISLYKDFNYFLLYTPENHDFTFRSSFLEDAAYSMCITLKKEALLEIKGYILNNYNIECYIPYVIKNKTLFNVCGIIEGKNPSLPPLVLTSHFDHVGTDLQSNTYGGALDNASGTAFMLELSRYVSSLGKPERTIIFASFNAEEFNCLGSKEFVNSHKVELSNGRVYNFDMIGSNNEVPLCIMGGKEDTPKNSFVKAVAAACDKQKIKYDYLFEDASDHSYFRKANIEAVTLSDKDLSRIHTIEDKSSYIDESSIERCFKLMNKEILRSAFHNNLALVYCRPLLVITVMLMLISLFFILKLCGKKENK